MAMTDWVYHEPLKSWVNPKQAEAAVVLIDGKFSAVLSIRDCAVPFDTLEEAVTYLETNQYAPDLQPGIRQNLH